MNVDVVEPIITVKLSLNEAKEFVAKNVTSLNYVPDISLVLADMIKIKLDEFKNTME